MSLHIDVRRSNGVYLYALLDGDEVLVKSVSRSYIRAAKRWATFKDTRQDRTLLMRWSALLGVGSGVEGLLLDNGDVWWREDHHPADA